MVFSNLMPEVLESSNIEQLPHDLTCQRSPPELSREVPCYLRLNHEYNEAPHFSELVQIT